MSTHTHPRAAPSTPEAPSPSRTLETVAYLLAGLAAVGAVTGLLTNGGPGRHDVETLRGATVTLYGEGLYRYDTWLVGAGNRGQDLVVLLVEVPLLLAAVRWCRRGGPVAAAALVGVLAFFAYFYVSMVFATAQNRLFPLYVAAAALAGFALAGLAARLDVRRVAASLPGRPGRRALTTYLLGLAGALTLAWLPGLMATDGPGRPGPQRLIRYNGTRVRQEHVPPRKPCHNSTCVPRCRRPGASPSWPPGNAWSRTPGRPG